MTAREHDRPNSGTAISWICVAILAGILATMLFTEGGVQGTLMTVVLVVGLAAIAVVGFRTRGRER